MKREHFEITWYDQEAGNAVLHNFRSAAYAPGDHRLPESHSLQKNQSEPFLPTGHDKDVATGVTVFELFDRKPSEKDDAVAGRTLVGQLFQFGPQIALSNNYIEKIWNGLQQIWEDSDHGVDALAGF